VGFNLYTGVTSLHNKIYADGIKEGKTFVSNQIVTEVTNTGQLRVNISTEEGLKNNNSCAKSAKSIIWQNQTTGLSS